MSDPESPLSSRFNAAGDIRLDTPHVDRLMIIIAFDYHRTIRINLHHFEGTLVLVSLGLPFSFIPSRYYHHRIADPILMGYSCPVLLVIIPHLVVPIAAHHYVSIHHGLAMDDHIPAKYQLGG